MHLNHFPMTSRTRMAILSQTARKSYDKILNCSSVGMVQQQLTHYLNDKKHCCANLPMATCTAIHMGKFCWTSIDQPEAFSLLACYHLAANSTTAIQLSGEEVVSMYLRSTEGMGLNESDVQKATKVVLHAPTDVDTLAKQLGVFGKICGAIFGKKSDLLLEMDDWITHIAKNEATYRNMQHFNPMFALQLACFIDRKVQLYLSLFLGQKWTSWKAHSQTTSSRGPYPINSKTHAIKLDHRSRVTHRLMTNLHLETASVDNKNKARDARWSMTIPSASG